MANVKDGATGTVLVAPSPATSGTSLTLNPGEGYRYPTAPFYVIAHPNNTIPTVSTSEKMLVSAVQQSTIAAGSNGVSLPQATINFVDTTGWPTSGSITIITSNGAQVVTYTGKTGTTITGASGGTGTMSTGGLAITDTFTIVRAQGIYSAQSVAITWRVSNAIFQDDMNNAAIISNEVPVGLVNGSNTIYSVASAGKVTGSLRVHKNGVRLKGSGNDFNETSTGFTMVTAPASGTILLVDYIIAGALNNIGTNSLISDEVVTGIVNSSNTVFTTARPYIAGALEVYINGLKQYRTTDYVETTPGSGIFTFNIAPLTGDVIRVNYQFNLNPASNADTVDGVHASASGGVLGALIADYGGWWAIQQTLTYVTANTFTAVGDITAWLQKGDKIWLTQTTSKYFYVTDIIFSAGITTVTVFAGTTFTLANAAITAPYYSKIENPHGFPHWFALTAPTWANITSPTNNEFRFKILGRTVQLHSRSIGTKSGTDNNLNFPFFSGLPALANQTTRSSLGVGHISGGGIGDAVAAITYIAGSIYLITPTNMTNGSSLTDVATNMSWEF